MIKKIEDWQDCSKNNRPPTPTIPSHMILADVGGDVGDVGELLNNLIQSLRSN